MVLDGEPSAPGSQADPAPGWDRPEDPRTAGVAGSITDARTQSRTTSTAVPRPRARALSDPDRANARRVDEYDIRTQSTETRSRRLSGGNQQKVVVARELSRPLSLLVASQPTRGVDIGAIEFLHRG